MPHSHIVKQGECLSLIARKYGFSKYGTIYDHPENAELRRKRPNPNVLYPGDVVMIPDREEATASLVTGKTHRFQVWRAKKVLRLVIRDHDDAPLAGELYVLAIDGESRAGETNGDGQLEEVVQEATTARLTIAGRSIYLRLGHLNPVEGTGGDISGVQARLMNLGYSPGPLDGRLGRRTRAALALFQADAGLSVDSELNDATRRALIAAHGC